MRKVGVRITSGLLASAAIFAIGCADLGSDETGGSGGDPTDTATGITAGSVGRADPSVPAIPRDTTPQRPPGYVAPKWTERRPAGDLGGTPLGIVPVGGVIGDGSDGTTSTPTGIGSCGAGQATTDGMTTPGCPTTPDDTNTMPSDTITIRSALDVAARRRALIQMLWGVAELPASESVAQEPTANCTIPGMTGVANAVELRIPMDLGEEGLACLFGATNPNGHLVVYNPGHFHSVADGSTWDDDGWTGFGDQRAVQSLLLSGYGVLVTYMPHFRPDDHPDGWEDPHAVMFRTLRPTAGSVWKYFIQPVTDSINYALSTAPSRGFPQYEEVHMLGLSGGGWTTVISAAVDPRIKVSIQVAGSEPLDFWTETPGNEEQTLPALYRVAAYRDLYILGASGTGRRQVQVLNRYDNCCFYPGWAGRSADTWELSVRGYESAVQMQLFRMQDPGAFRLEIDNAAVTHQISRHALAEVILPELDRRVR